MPPDLLSLFEVNVPWWELVLRGTAMYWFLFIIFRFVLRRDVGAIGIADVLLLVIVADASQNAMSGSYDTISEGMLLVSTVVAWNYLLDWAAFRFRAFRRFAEPAPLPLIRHGRVLRANLREEMMSVDDLKSKLREHGVDDLADVKAAYMEADGQVTVIRRSGKG